MQDEIIFIELKEVADRIEKMSNLSPFEKYEELCRRGPSRKAKPPLTPPASKSIIDSEIFMVFEGC